MCNSYRIQPRRSELARLPAKVSAAAGKLPRPLVRKSDPGIVVLADERVEIMRWGFSRPFNPAINNTRSDKLDSAIWRDAFRERRCVIPMSCFYEWCAIGGGRKQAHDFHHPDGDYLWIAGIWEGNPEHGPCYSMITTGAGPVMEPIHHRMPAVLLPEEIGTYLTASADWKFRPFRGPLVETPCESPLAKPRPPDPQQELF
jgi:putative SOS response-associated peptidase YedK